MLKYIHWDDLAYMEFLHTSLGSDGDLWASHDTLFFNLFIEIYDQRSPFPRLGLHLSHVELLHLKGIGALLSFLEVLGLVNIS